MSDAFACRYDQDFLSGINQAGDADDLSGRSGQIQVVEGKGSVRQEKLTRSMTSFLPWFPASLSSSSSGRSV